MRNGLLGAVSGAVLMAGCTAAQAGAFGIREQSVVGGGQAFAGAAAGSAGLASTFWNPATITMSPGYTTDVNATYIDPSAKIRVSPPTPTIGLGQSGDIGLSGVVPASFSAYQLSDNVWIGLASTAPFGLVTKPNQVWAGETYSRSSRVFSANFNPIIGVKVNDWLSFGAGPVVEYLKVRLNQAVAPTLTAPSAILEGNDIGVGATVGATITPMAGTTIGIGYRSSVEHELSGTLRSFAATPAGAVPVVFQARVKLNMPDQVNVGLTQAITDQFRVNMGFEFTNWSRLKLPVVVGAVSGQPLTVVPLGYNDGYYYALGAEYDLDPSWTVRAGVAYETSPIDARNRGTRVPDTDRVHASVGATYRYSQKLDFSIFYNHIFTVGDKRLAILPGNIVYNGLPFVGDVKAEVNIVGVSARYRWDEPQVAQAAPIIRKY